DQLVSVNGNHIANSSDLKNILSESVVSDEVSVQMRTSSGHTKSATVTLRSFSATDRLAFFIMPMVLSLVFLIVSLWIFGLRRTEPAGRAFTVFTTSLAIGTGALFDLYTSHYFTYIWTLAVGLAGGALIDLALGFPQEARFVIRRPYLRWIGYGIALVLIIRAYGTLFDFSQPLAYINAWLIIYAFTALAALFYFGALGYRAVRAYSPIVKSQARTILFGALVSFVPVVIWLLYTSLRKMINPNLDIQGFNPYLFLFMIVFPMANGYVIMRFRLLRPGY